MDRRSFLASAALGAGSLARADPAERTNLLFVLADQWRSSAFGFGSDAVVRTPNLDRLGAQGANWKRAYAANPVCTPNRACILTGRYSHQTGMIRNDLQLPPGETCWPEVFRSAGYATHYVGKWHMDGTGKPGFVPPGWRRRGFETFEGFNRGHVYHRPWGFGDAGEPLAPKRRRRSRTMSQPSRRTSRSTSCAGTATDRSPATCRGGLPTLRSGLRGPMTCTSPGRSCLGRTSRPRTGSAR